MRLTLENIDFIKIHFYNGLAYEYFVALKSSKVSDTRCYGCFENLQRFDKLPKTVQVFIHQAGSRSVIDTGDGFKVITLRRG